MGVKCEAEQELSKTIALLYDNVILTPDQKDGIQALGLLHSIRR